MERPLNYAEAAEYLGLAEVTLRKRVTRKQIGYIKLGRLVKFRISDLDAYIESCFVPQENKTPS
tara:strand:+ start:125 stop:316 length:192 start_codon:yes stop_codon:yes gene_type:complete